MTAWLSLQRICCLVSICMQVLRHPGAVFDKLMEIICRLASYGLIHCDFNEFNLLVSASDGGVGCHSMRHAS